MISLKAKTDTHPTDLELANFLAGGASKKDRERIEKHLSSCNHCLDKMVAAHEAASMFNKKGHFKKLKEHIMKKINIYLLLALLSFSLSFLMPRYFIQSLVATLLLGIKWVADSKSTRMLVMIHEAWKKDGGRGASDALEMLETRHNSRFSAHKMERPKSLDLGLHIEEGD